MKSRNFISEFIFLNKSIIKVFITFEIVLFVSFWSKAQTVCLVSESIKNKIDSTYLSLIKKHDVKGLSLGIVENGKLVFAKGYGFEDEEKNIAATSKSIYRIGSITKSFTALSLLQMQRDGKLSIDDELKQHLPEFSIGFQKNSPHPIIIRNILSHTSGLPSDILNGFFTETPPSTDWTISQVKQLKMSYPNNFSLSYSNLGYALLGEVVERVSKMDYETYIRDNIFSLLGMNSSFIHLIEGKVTPPSYYNNKLIKEPLIRDAPAGLIHSNVEDMSNYLLMLLNRGKYNNHELIDSLSILEMEKDQTTELQLKNQNNFGLGLYSSKYVLKSGKDSSLVNIIGHGGDTYAFHADMKYIPELGVGVIVLTNSSSGVQVNAGEILLRAYFHAKDGSILGDIVPKPNPEVKTDFESGTYVIMNSLVNAENEDKITFKQGPAKVIAKKANEGFYRLKALLFGFIPIKIKDQVFYFERLNGTVFIKGLNLKNNSTEYLGCKIEKTKISDSWKKSFGNYKVINAIPCSECEKMGIDFNHFTLEISEKDGLLKMSLGGKGVEMSDNLFASCESENCAITIGIGRGNGETFQILENGNIYYSGFEFKRMEK